MPDTTVMVGSSSNGDLRLSSQPAPLGNLAGGALSINRLGRIDAAVIKAVAYADVFDWPLSPSEVHRYLTVAARPDEVDAALVSSRLSRWVSSIGGFYVLHGREPLVEGRHRKAAVSARLWPHAIRYGQILSYLPWVRLVAVTGSLAVGAATDDADIDLFIVTDDGRLWLARALTIGVAKVACRAPSTRGLRLCPNYLLAGSALELPERDLYTARELAQLVPLFGRDAYHALLERNLWYRDFLPNHPGYLDNIGDLGGGGGVRRLVEAALRNRLVGRVERWEMDRKIARLSVGSPSGEVRFDQSTCKGHFDGYRQHALEAFDARLRRLEAAGS